MCSLFKELFLHFLFHRLLAVAFRQPMNLHQNLVLEIHL